MTDLLRKVGYKFYVADSDNQDEDHCFVVERVIGWSPTTTVYLVLDSNLEHGENRYALKETIYTNLKDQEMAYRFIRNSGREKENLRTLSKPIKHEVWIEEIVKFKTHQIKSLSGPCLGFSSILVMEYCPNGDLFQALSGAERVKHTHHFGDWLQQLKKGVKYLHSMGIIHRYASRLTPIKDFLALNRF
jgi:serine/threonine protein kinase